jgi:hypothetical protein
MQRAAPMGTVTVPVPNHSELKMGTLRSIIRNQVSREANLNPDFRSLPLNLDY